MEFVSQLSILLVLGIALLALMLNKGHKTPAAPPVKKGPGDGTVLVPFLYLEQLDPRSMKCYKRFCLPRELLFTRGISISRNDVPGDINLAGVFEETGTVSTKHAIVVMDEDGIFIQDNGSSNGMHLAQSMDLVDEVAICDNTVIYLGQQPVRFVYPKLTAASRSSRLAGAAGKIWGRLRGFAGSFSGGASAFRSKFRNSDTGYRTKPTRQQDRW